MTDGERVQTAAIEISLPPDLPPVKSIQFHVIERSLLKNEESSMNTSAAQKTQSIELKTTE